MDTDLEKVRIVKIDRVVKVAECPECGAPAKRVGFTHRWEQHRNKVMEYTMSKHRCQDHGEFVHE